LLLFAIALYFSRHRREFCLKWLSRISVFELFLVEAFSAALKKRRCLTVIGQVAANRLQYQRRSMQVEIHARQ
jgi:hypothetical protein